MGGLKKKMVWFVVWLAVPCKKNNKMKDYFHNQCTDNVVTSCNEVASIPQNTYTIVTFMHIYYLRDKYIL